MKRRQTILITLAILVLAIISTLVLAGLKETPKRRAVSNEKINVLVGVVENKAINISISVDGKLVAREKIEIFSEVSGIMEVSSGDFLEGIHFNKGELMMNINSDEAYQSLKSLKSNLMNQISTTLPDLKFDYPESYEQWSDYLTKFDVDKKMDKLPEPVNSREKFFISGKGIYKTYYDIESKEIRLAKYKMYAPFSGVVTASSIKRGTLVRAGQKLGEFVKDSEYELESLLSIKDIGLVEIGDRVKLYSEELNKSWEAVISRISSKIDANTQNVIIYSLVKAADLKEGMFLKGDVFSKKTVNGVILNRKLLLENNKIFTVEGNIIQEQSVNVIQEKSDIVVVEGLKDGTFISMKTKKLHKGMEVNATR